MHYNADVQIHLSNYPWFYFLVQYNSVQRLQLMHLHYITCFIKNTTDNCQLSNIIIGRIKKMSKKADLWTKIPKILLHLLLIWIAKKTVLKFEILKSGIVRL